MTVRHLCHWCWVHQFCQECQKEREIEYSYSKAAGLTTNWGWLDLSQPTNHNFIDFSVHLRQPLDGHEVSMIRSMVTRQSMTYFYGIHYTITNVCEIYCHVNVYETELQPTTVV